MKDKKLQLRMLYTLLISCIFCITWIGLEKLITGQIQDRVVDNVIMVLFIPVIWLATSPICDKLAAYKEKKRRRSD